MLLALLGGAPATAIVAALAWMTAPTLGLRIVACVLAIGFWLACGYALRRRLVFPLQALANLVEAVRFGDYTLRGRRAQPGDALGEVVRELNSLGATLQAQRLASVEAAQLMQTVVAELDQAVFAFDTERRLRLVNRAGAELLGRAAEALIGRPAGELGLEELLECSEGGAVRALVFAGRSGRFEVRCRQFREAGLPHTLLMVSDLSRALREEERRSWQRLIRVIGHEINNSLTPIKSLAGTLRDMMAAVPAGSAPAARGTAAGALVALPERADVLEGLNLIGDRADSLSKFVATYSQLARLPAPAKSSVSLNGLLQRLVATGPFAAVRLAAPLEIRLAADPGQLEQAFINLLKNAIEATDGSKEVELVLERARDAAVIEVRDSGPGIANPENLFVPFFTTKPGGSGIGLTLSRQIVEAHGGTLTLGNRTDGEGAVARVTLPLADAAGSATSARTSA